MSVAAAGLMLAAEQARALTITPSFDSSIVNAPNASAIENSIDFSTQEIGNLFSNPGTVNILFKLGPGNFLGESDSSFYYDTYSTVTGELQANLAANPQNTVLATALANLPNGNDANGAQDIETTSAEFRLALGDDTATPCFNAQGNFVNGCNAVYDGVITLSSSQPIDYTRPVPAYNGTNLEYDAVRVEEHEIDEVLGGGGSGTTLGSSDQGSKFGILDLYRYSAPHTPSYTSASTATSYFSIDGGVTDIIGFNQNSSGDLSDWGPNVETCSAGGSGGPAGDVQDAFSCNNEQADVTTSSPEYTELEAIGYDPTSSSGSSNVTWDCSTNPDPANHSGSGGAVKSTSCTQIVTGTNTYTGGTVIQAGTLQLGNGANMGSITGDVADSGTLAFDRNDTVTFTGAISGTGSVQQLGVGTTILVSAQSYSGGTLILNGTLQIGSNGSSASIIGNVNGSGTLAFNAADTTFAGVISGPGSLVNMGPGYLYLTGNNTFTGGTTISGGAIVIGNSGTTGALVGNIVDNARLYVDLSNTFTINGVIGGSGLFAQYGTGTTILAADNSYTGLTVIANGTLQMGTSNAISASSDVVMVSGASFALAGFNQTIGSLQGAGTVSLGAATLTTGGDNVTSGFSGTISGTGGIVKAGNGTFVLTGTNTYTGGTTISGGTLQLGNGGTTGSIVGNVVNNGALVFDGADMTLGAISGSGSVLNEGNGYVYLTGNSTYTGGTTISAGAIVLGNGGAGGSITGNVVDNGRFYVQQSDTYTFAGTISGSGLFAQSGTGTTILSADNTYTGLTVIANGTLQMGTSNAISASSDVLMVSGATFALEGFDQVIGSLSGGGNVVLGPASLTMTENAQSPLFSGVISGTGSLAITGSDYLYLTGNSTYTGGTTISSGAIVLGNGGTSGAITGNVVDNARLYVDRSDTYTFSGMISGTGLFAQFGSGTTILAADNSYTGPTVIANGTLAMGTSNAISASSDLVMVSGTTFELNGFDQTIGSLEGSGNVTLGAATLTTGSDNATSGFAGTISGTGALVKAGNGIFVLSGNDSYSGGTTIANGTIEVASNAALGTGAVAMNGTSPTLLLNNGINLANTIDIDTASFIDVDGSDSATISGALVGSAPFEKDGTGTLVLDHDNSATYSGNISYHGTLVAGTSGAFGSGTVTALDATFILADGVVDATPTVLNDDLTVIQNGGTAAITAPISEAGGSWGFFKQGPGAVLLTAANTYTGATIVQAGTLVILGSVGGSAAVQSGATLAVAGQIAGALTVQSGGSLSSANLPANVVVGLTTLGAASYSETGSTLAVRYGGASTGFASDAVSVSGNVVLNGGTLEAVPYSSLSDYTFDQRYTVVRAGGSVTGSFSNSGAFTPDPSDPALLERVRYDLGGVVLEVRKLIDFTAAGGATTTNTLSVAGAINASEMSAGDSWASVIDALAALAPDAQRAALNQMSGESLVDAQRIAGDSVDAFGQLLQSHIIDFDDPSAAAEQRANVGPATAWIAILGRSDALGSKDGQPGFVTQLAGLAAGADAVVADGLTLGVAGGSQHPSQSSSALKSGVSGDGTFFGAYGRYDWDDVFVGASVAHAETNLSEHRAIVIGTLTDTASASFGQHADEASLYLGTRLPALGGLLEPTLALHYLSAAQGAIAEHDGGTGLALNLTPVTTDALSGSAGARWDILLRSGDVWLKPDIDGALSFFGHDTLPSAFANFEGTPVGAAPFRVIGLRNAPLSGIAGAGLGLGANGSPIALHLNYTGEFAGRLVEHTGTLSITYAW